MSETKDKQKYPFLIWAEREGMTPGAYIKDALHWMRGQCPGKQPDEWRYIDWLLAHTAQLEAENASLRAQAEGLREALERIKANASLYKEDSRTVIRFRLEMIYNEAINALAATPAPAREQSAVEMVAEMREERMDACLPTPGEEREAEKAVVEAAVEYVDHANFDNFLAIGRAVKALRAAREKGGAKS